MRRTNLIPGVTLGLVLLAASAPAGTFRPAELLPEAGIDVLDRSVAQATLDRELFGEPHASVVIGRVDVYGRFPYLEARYFQVVSDPQWNRLLFGQTDRGLDAFDGAATSFGSLKEPRGLSSDEDGRVYVADTGNDRVLVFETSTEFEEMQLVPVFAIDGLHRPHDVAFSNGGTPFDRSDDRLYVADTGANRVLRVDIDGEQARVVSEIGGLGSGEGRFAGPTAVAVARFDGLDQDAVYVADSHSQRLVRLLDQGHSLDWDGALTHDLPEITDLDTDHWGNVYAASPRGGEIRKFTRDMLPVDSLRDGLDHPRGVHVPLVTVHDHRRGTVERAGRGNAVVVEHWGETSGLRRVDLGVDVQRLAVDDDALRFTLTDRAAVTARVLAAEGSRVEREIALGAMDAGARSVSLAEILAGVPAGDARLEIEAVSTYDDAIRATTAVAFAVDGDHTATPREAGVLGASPNPFNPRTTIEFVVPSGPSMDVSLEIVDARGRVVRSIPARSFATGRHGFDWNGTDDAGQAVGSGIYLYRVDLGGTTHAGKLALVK